MEHAVPPSVDVRRAPTADDLVHDVAVGEHLTLDLACHAHRSIITTRASPRSLHEAARRNCPEPRNCTKAGSTCRCPGLRTFSARRSPPGPSERLGRTARALSSVVPVFRLGMDDRQSFRPHELDLSRCGWNDVDSIAAQTPQLGRRSCGAAVARCLNATCRATVSPVPPASCLPREGEPVDLAVVSQQAHSRRGPMSCRGITEPNLAPTPRAPT